MVEQTILASDAPIFSKDRVARFLLLLAAVALLAFPIMGAGEFATTLMTEALILGIWAMSLDLLVGYTGLVAFGHAAGFGLGAYAAGYFAQHVTSEFFFVAPVAEATVVLVALLTGFVVSRISGVAFAIVTLAISQVLLQIGVAWTPVTGGMDGLIGVPLPKIFGYSLEFRAELLSPSRGSFDNRLWRSVQVDTFSVREDAARYPRKRATCRCNRHQRTSTQMGRFCYLLVRRRIGGNFTRVHEGRNYSDGFQLVRIRLRPRRDYFWRTWDAAWAAGGRDNRHLPS